MIGQRRGKAPECAARCSESVAQNQHEAINAFIQGTIAEGAPIVPISAQLKYNVDAVCEYIVKKIPVPHRDFVTPPQMIVIRSFDVNKPGSEVEDLKGGVAGGSILQVCSRPPAGNQDPLLQLSVDAPSAQVSLTAGR